MVILRRFHVHPAQDHASSSERAEPSALPLVAPSRMADAPYFELHS